MGHHLEYSFLNTGAPARPNDPYQTLKCRAPKFVTGRRVFPPSLCSRCGVTNRLELRAGEGSSSSLLNNSGITIGSY